MKLAILLALAACGRAPAPAPDPRCTAATVSGGYRACTPATLEVSPLATCEAQCRCGDGVSCGIAAKLVARKGDAGHAQELATRGCDLDAAFACGEVAGDAERDRETSLRRRDCDDGDGPTCFELARWLDILDGDTTLHEPPPVDRAEAFAQRRACDRGDAHACAELADRSSLPVVAKSGEHGEEAAALYARGVRLTREACDRGDGYACAQLEHYTSDHDHGLTERACELGHAPSCELAGLGVIGPESDRWLDRGCRLGYPDTCHLLAAQKARAAGDRDDPTAIILEKKACKLGDERACPAARAGHGPEI